MRVHIDLHLHLTGGGLMQQEGPLACAPSEARVRSARSRSWGGRLVTFVVCAAIGAGAVTVLQSLGKRGQETAAADLTLPPPVFRGRGDHEAAGGYTPRADVEAVGPGSQSSAAATEKAPSGGAPSPFGLN
jgi:hypothetical protein